MLRPEMSRSRSKTFVYCLVLTAACLRAADDSPVVRAIWTPCCSGGYTAERATAAAQRELSRSNAAIQWIAVTDGEVVRPGTSHGVPFGTALNLLFLGNKKLARATLLLKSPAGTAIDHWDGPSGTFSRRVISGENPFRLTDSIELVSLGLMEEPTRETRQRITLYCISSRFEDQSEDALLVSRLRSFFPKVAIEVRIGDSPFFGQLLYLVQMVPVQGWHFAPATESSVKTGTISISP